MVINNKERAEMLRQLAGTNVSLCIQCGRCSANCPV
ncbi:MAG: 4Fe-4S dicluster domain-containing protein, partial [Phascolarctobacterium sp.]|nr:4Fe-4S dicluster domain-containing protein [Phascolarctobacterium sp.]